MSRVLLAIDQGTSSTKAVPVDEAGSAIARGGAPVSCTFPRPGWVEQDPEEIWQSVLGAVEACLAQAPDAAPAALAISNQRESALVWNRATGAPAGAMIGWQDSRTAPDCDRLRAEGAEALVRSRTGLTLDPMFSATTLRWLLERAPGGLDAAAGGELCAGTVDAWLVHRLTGGDVFACEAGNASRTQLLRLQDATWDPELLDLFGVPAATLPPVRRSDVLFADGGATAGASLMQIQADLLGRPVLASATAEMSALPRPSREFRPVLSAAERRRRRETWSEAVRRSRGHAVQHHELEESAR
jgi:glycerol kinase